LSGLIFSCITALAATLWGVSSCRFAFVDFVSDRGDFSDFYLDPTSDGDPVYYRAGIGEFGMRKTRRFCLAFSKLI
jgi:hypothetical protein